MAIEGTTEVAPRLRFPEFAGTGDLWATTLGSIASQIYAGGTPDTSEKAYWGGQIRWMNSGELSLKRIYEVAGRISDLGLQNSSTRIIPERSVLIGLAGQGKTRGTIAMNMVPLCTNQSIAAILPNESEFDSEFIYHNLDNRYDELRSLSAGDGGRGGLNLQLIRSLHISLPSLPEQRKIAGCLTSLDNVIAVQRRKVEGLKTYKRGLIQELFPREGETLPCLRFPEFRDAPEWREYQVGDLVDALPPPKKLSTASYGTSGTYPIVDQSPSQVCGWTDDSEALIRPSQPVVVFGDHTCTVKLLREPFAQGADGIKVLYPRPSVMGEFLYQALLLRPLVSSEYKRHFAELKNKLISVPLRETNEQERVVSVLSTLDTHIAVETAKLGALRTHKKGLVQQLFPAPEEA